MLRLIGGGPSAAEVDRDLAAETPMHVFQVSEFEWWAGATLKDCIAAAAADWNLEDSEVVFGQAHQLTHAELLHLRYFDPHTGRIRNFYDELQRRIAQRQKFPQFFASTEEEPWRTV